MPSSRTCRHEKLSELGLPLALKSQRTVKPHSTDSLSIAISCRMISAMRDGCKGVQVQMTKAESAVAQTP